MAIPPRSGTPPMTDAGFDYPPDHARATEPGRPDGAGDAADKQPVGAILLGALAAIAVIVAALVILS